jgi:hypothetical protein
VNATRRKQALREAPRDPAGAFLAAGSTAFRALLIVVGVIGLLAVLVSSVNHSVIRNVGDQVAGSTTAAGTP